MRALAPLTFAAFCILIGHQVAQSALASINTHQEAMAEAICKLDPSECGQTR